ncbi:TOMM precursor leader peptide-binding protein [Streptomyces spiramenti]|uniref:TOMM leader peptide-binding protein n=1 Tax=Streptomyces spiramenti TaxID=2720606 RepID=A0ABX1AIJ0_9ACTN|nr:TOMM precursor leader peptide-binding protein [Streptomyces spiramenti]NJP66969.1 TOMM precursor leader peptide-binding protein [Streptomyces spiramenti]
MAAAAFETLADTRPRIRRDVLYTETPGGVLFHNADGGFHLTGRTAYRFATLIVPHLDGGNRLAEICGGLGESQRAMVAELVSSLLERDFARDHRPAEEDGPAGAAVEPLPAEVAERFAPQIEYVDHYADDSARRFARFRGTRVAVLGTGEVADWCALSLLRNGAAVIGTEAATGERVAGEAAELVAAGCPTEVAVVGGTADFPGAWDAYDVVLLTGAAVAPRVHALLSAGVPAGRTVVPVWTFGERAVVGPRSTAGSTGCWSCALLRLGATVDAAAAADLWREVATGESGAGGPFAAAPDALRGPVAAMVGNLLAYEVFRVATGALPSETDRQVQIQDLVSLDVTAEPVHPHPACGICPPHVPGPVVAPDGLTVAPVPTVESARDAEQIVADLTTVSEALVRPHTGVFARFDDEPLTQTPLKATVLELPLGHGRRQRIPAFDVHHLAGARQRALREAAVRYVDHVVPPAAARPEAPGRRHLPDALTTGGGTGATAAQVGAWARAASLLGDGDALVPLAAVRPLGAHNRDRLHRATAAGGGAGSDAGQAAGHGLLDALAHDALERALRGATEVRILGDELYVENAELTFLRKSAVNLGTTVELLDLGEAARTGVHVVLAREADPDRAPRWSLAAALDGPAAAAGALRDVLGAVQLAVEGAADAEAVTPPRDLDPRVLAVGEAMPVLAPATTFPEVLRRLRSAGRDALYVPTTPADLAAADLHTARVLLTEDGNGDH